jgi:hypothetical protein
MRNLFLLFLFASCSKNINTIQRNLKLNTHEPFMNLRTNTNLNASFIIDSSFKANLMTLDSLRKYINNNTKSKINHF